MQAGRIFVCILSAVVGVSLPQAVFASETTHTKHAHHKSTDADKKRDAPVARAAKTPSTHKAKASSKSQSVARASVAKAAPARKATKTVSKPSEDALELDAAGNPRIQSSAFYVQDVASGQVLLQKNSNVVQPIASITKLMTMMVVLDAHQNLEDIIEVTEDDVDHLRNSSSHLPVGTRLSREDLMHLALMASENRAASALARNYPGGMQPFLAAMNAKAHQMGLQETHFFDGTGLTKNNVSSARDLAIMVANAAHYPLIREFSTSAEYTVDLGHGRNRAFHNTNALVKSSDWQIDVSKTGFINESGRCLVMQAWFNNKQLAIVLLDSVGHYTRIGDANRIRKWLEASANRHPVAAGASVRRSVSAAL